MKSNWLIGLIGLMLAGCNGYLPMAEQNITLTFKEPPDQEITEKKSESSPIVSEKFAGVHFVDQVGSKFLFRGPSPLNEDESAFDYDNLVVQIRQAGQEAGVTIPEDFYLVDVSLLHIDELSDRRRIIKEENFFRENPQLGQFQSMDTWGTDLDWNDEKLSAESRNLLASELPNWLGDPLPKQIERLRSWLENPNLPKKVNKPVVIYVHCYEGCDRTGEMIGAYSMRFKNASWEDVNSTNSGYCGRQWSCDNYRATQWYCAWLREEESLPLNCEVAFKCLRDRND